MYIAVCDDNPHDLRQTAEIIAAHAASSCIPVRYSLFDNAEQMLKASKIERFTHYILDVSMSPLDGITAAHEIRTFDTDAKIVFLTSFKEYAYQGYRVKAYDYLLKPITGEQLLPILAHFGEEESCFEKCLCIQDGRSIFRLPLAHLSHLEVNQKKLYFFMTSGEIRRIPGSMSEYEKLLLAHPEFIKIHRSYIVNLGQISSLSPEGCMMFSGKNLPVSRLLYHQVQSRFMAHLFHGQEG